MSKLVFLLAAILLATSAKADRYYWTSSSQEIQVRSTGLNQQYPFELKRIHEYTKIETVMQDNWVYETEAVRRNCETFVCFGSQRDTPLWQNYLDDSDDQKPYRLTLAVEGLSSESAGKLIRRGYFKYAPQSWLDFRQDMNEAVKVGLIRQSEFSKIMFENARLNLKNMGYVANECSIEMYSCNSTKEVRVNRPIPVTKQVVVRNAIEVKQVYVSVIAENLLLLPHEVEVFNIELQPESNSILVQQRTKYATYQTQVSADRSEVRLVAQTRQKIDINPRQIHNVQIREEAGQAALYVEVSPELLATDDPNDKLVLTYQVKHCVPGWTGTCGMFSSWMLRPPVSVVVGQPTNRILVDLSGLSKPIRLELSYQMQRPNSKWYSPKPTREDTTNTINIKR